MKKKDLELNFPNRITKIFITPEKIIAELTDKREFSILRVWLDRPDFFNFNHAADEQLEDYEVIRLGESIISLK